MRCCLQCVLSPCRRRRPSGNETAPVCMCQEAHHRSLSYQLQTTPTAELHINDSNTATNAHFTPPASRQCCLCRVRRCEFSRPDKCVLRRECVGRSHRQCLRRWTHSDAERACQADSIHTATPDKTRRSCLYRKAEKRNHFSFMNKSFNTHNVI